MAYQAITRTLQPGIARSPEQVEPSCRDLWRELALGVPYKGMNWDDLAQGATRPARIQNMHHVGGVHGSAAYRQPNVKAFIHYPASWQYSFVVQGGVNNDGWTLAWSWTPMNVTWLPGPTFTHFHIMSGGLDNGNWAIGSWRMARLVFSINLRMWFSTNQGWKAVTWTVPAFSVNGIGYPHTFSIRREPNALNRLELWVDGASLGVRSHTGQFSWGPGFQTGVTVGGYNPHPTLAPAGYYGQWHTVCAWNRRLDDVELLRWHDSPLAMFTPARRRVHTPPELVAPGPPERPCDWFDPQAVATWLQTQAGQGWLMSQPAQSWLMSQAGQSWLTSQAVQGWLALQAAQGWMQTRAVQGWLASQAGQIWLQTQAGRDWATPVTSRDWFADKECN